MKVQEALGLLGLKVKDRVTGMTGIVTSISFDLYGCIQAIVHPGLNEKKEFLEQKWFDLNRLVILSKKPVMERPPFVVIPGPAEKPAFYKE